MKAEIELKFYKDLCHIYFAVSTNLGTNINLKTMHTGLVKEKLFIELT